MKELYRFCCPRQTWGLMNSFAFDSIIDTTNEYQGNAKTYNSQHQEECVTYTSIIAYKEAKLQETIHIQPGIEVYAISKHKDGR